MSKRHSKKRAPAKFYWQRQDERFCDVTVHRSSSKHTHAPLLGIAYKCRNKKGVCFQQMWHVPPSVKKRAMKAVRKCRASKYE